MARWQVPAGAVILTAVSLAPLNVAGTAVAIPYIAAQLGSDTVGLQWAVNGFNVAFAICMIIVGVLADRFGPRRTFAAGLLVVAASSAVSSLAQDLAVLDVGRAIAGVGCAAVMAGGLAMISNTYAIGPARSRMFALFGVSVGIGLAFGPTVMGALTEVIGWRGLYALFGVIAIVAVIQSRRLPSGHRPRERGQPVFDLGVMRRPRFIAFALVPLVPAVGFVPIYTYLPVALSAVFDMSAAQAGAFMLPMAAPVLLGPMLAARLVHRVSWVRVETVVRFAFAVLLVGNLGMLLMSPDRPLVLIVVPLMLVSLGYGLQMGMVDGEAMASVPDGSSGTAAGVVNFCRTGSAAIIVTVYGMLLAGFVGQSLPVETAADVVAGQFGHADAYAGALHSVTLLAAGGVVVMGALVGWLQHRARLAEDDPGAGGPAL